MTEKAEHLIAEARRLENDYGDNYEVMSHMSALADALEAATRERAAVPDAATETETLLQAIAEGDQCIDQAMKRVEALEAERDAALAAIERVRAIHVRDTPSIGGDWCLDDHHKWPCPTVVALDGAPEPETAPENYEPKCNCEHVKRHTSPPLPVEGEKP